MKNVYLINGQDNRIENIILTEDEYTPPGGFSIIENDGQYQIGDIYGEEKPAPTADEIAEATKQLIRNEIDELERGNMIPRVTREFILVVMEKEAKASNITSDQLYNANIGYRKLKDLDSQIRALRAKL